MSGFSIDLPATSGTEPRKVPSRVKSSTPSVSPACTGRATSSSRRAWAVTASAGGEAHGERPLAHQADLAAQRVRHVQLRHQFSSIDQDRRRELAHTIVEEGLGLLPAGVVVGISQKDGDQGHAIAGARRHHAVPGVGRGPGLHAVHPRVLFQEDVAVLEFAHALVHARVGEFVLGSIDHAPERWVSHGVLGHGRQVPGRGIVVLKMQSVGVGEVRVGETHLFGLLVHPVGRRPARCRWSSSAKVSAASLPLGMSMAYISCSTVSTSP